jgi:hypothetical protein
MPILTGSAACANELHSKLTAKIETRVIEAPLNGKSLYLST